MTRLLGVCGIAALLAQSVIAQGTGTTRDIAVLNFAAMPNTPLPPSNGNLEVVNRNGSRVLKSYGTPASFQVTLPEQLPENFTLEFDLIPKECCSAEDLAFEGTLTSDATFARVSWGREQQVVYGGGSPFTATIPGAMRAALPGQLTHIMVTFEGSLLKLYTNGERIYTVTDRRFPRGNVLRVSLSGDDEDKGAVYLTRLRVAEGIGTPGVAAVMATSTGTGMLSAPATASSSQGMTGASTGVTGLSVTLDAQGKPVLKWDAVPDATSYAVMRWNVSDFSCCNNNSPPGATNTASWQDVAFPKDGTYAYRVYATTATGIVTGETRTVYGSGVLRAVGGIGAAGTGTIQSVAPTSVTGVTATQTGTGMLSAPAPAPPPSPAGAPIVGTSGIANRTVTTSSTSTASCAAITNFKVAANGATAAHLSWDPLSSSCHWLASRTGDWLSWYALLRWPTGDPTGCPTNYDELSGFTLVQPPLAKSSRFPACGLFAISAWPHAVSADQVTTWDDKYGLEGGPYTYRLWPVLEVSCERNITTCSWGSMDRAFPWSQASVTLPLSNVATRPTGGPIPPPPVLQAPAHLYLLRSTSRVRLHWSAVEGAAFYRITRVRNTGDPETIIDEEPVAAFYDPYGSSACHGNEDDWVLWSPDLICQYFDYDVTVGTLYSYRVWALSAPGVLSPPSPVASVTFTGKYP